jgi:hypothetical protein
MRTRVSFALVIPLVFSWAFACAPGSRPAGTTPAAPNAAQAEAPPAPDPAPLDGEACTGAIDAPPPAARAVRDEALLREALDLSGKGKLCTGRVYEAVGPVTVYRVWHAARAYTEFGRWWSFSRPSGPVAAYREQNAICAEWSALDVVSECTIKAGARFVVGPGQSARCDGGVVYPKSAVNQVYIPNDTRAGKVFVEGCRQLGPFQ